jgi:hypothetical protein
LIIAASTLLLSGVVNAERLNTSGRITLLRVHDVGTAYGPSSDQIDVEVVIQLDSEPGKAFGFQLRDDANKSTREGMLSLLRDAFNNNRTVNIDYDITPGKKNGVIVRVWLGTVTRTTAGNLEVTTPNLPTTSPVRVTGPTGFSRNIFRTTTLTGLTPGNYTITAQSFVTGRPDHPSCRTHTPNTASQPIVVTENQTARARVSYTSQSCNP